MGLISGSYVYLEDVKERLLIQSTDTTYDAAISKVALEATYLVDSILYYYTASLEETNTKNPIYWRTQVLTLINTGFVICTSSDIGKYVKDDGVEIGTLLTYDNTLRKWWIKTTSTILVNSVMSITNGTGAGTAQANSSMDALPPIISAIAADFTASIFKRRMFPDEVKIRGDFIPPTEDTMIDAQGWYALAFKKIQSFIRSTYGKPKFKLIQGDSSIYGKAGYVAK